MCPGRNGDEVRRKSRRLVQLFLKIRNSATLRDMGTVVRIGRRSTAYKTSRAWTFFITNKILRHLHRKKMESIKVSIRPSWVASKIRENSSAAGTQSRTPMGEFTGLPEHWLMKGCALPRCPPQKLHPRETANYTTSFTDNCLKQHWLILLWRQPESNGTKTSLLYEVTRKKLQP